MGGWLLLTIGVCAQASGATESATGAGSSPEVPDWVRRVQVGGYVQVDTLFFGQDDRSRAQLDDIEDAVNFRRARVILSGPVSERVDYRFGLDFGGPGRPSFLDARIDIGLVGTSAADPVEPLFDTRDSESIGDDFLLLRLGRFKQPQGLSALAGSGDLMFLERATPTAFIAFRQTGVSLWGSALDRHVTYGVSGYRFAGDVFGDVDGDTGYGASGRLTTLFELGPDTADTILHLGGHLATETFQDRTDGYTATPGVGFQELDFGSSGDLPVPSFLQTGEFPADRAEQIAAEAALRVGSVLVRGEAIASATARPDAPTASFFGWYGEVGWCLTGERRGYNRAFGYFGGLTPETNFLDGGPGAIELAARYDALDLTDAGLDGGVLQAQTIGLNWYWSPRLKWQANVIFSQTDRNGIDDARATIAALRMQFAY